MRRIYAKFKDGLTRLLQKTPIFLGGVLLLILCFAFIYGMPKLYFHYLEPTASFVSDKERIETEDQLRRTALQILGGMVVAFGLYLTYRRIKATEEQVKTQGQQVEAFRRQVAVAEDGQITERFTRAVEQLGNESIHIRLGGIYALERLANDSDKDHGTIMEILAAFVRERGPVKPPVESGSSDQKPFKFIFLGEDIIAALTVLGRRKMIAGEEPPNLNFTNFWRVGRLQLVLANLSFVNANFLEANLFLANLRGSIFSWPFSAKPISSGLISKETIYQCPTSKGLTSKRPISMGLIFEKRKM
jgi:hypothetical protein